MRKFVCRDIIPGCAEVITGPDDQSVLDQVVAHVADDHGLVKPPLALVELVVATTQNVADARHQRHLRLVDSVPAGRPVVHPRRESVTEPIGLRAIAEDSSRVAAISSITAGPREPVAEHLAYRHECLYYRGTDEFVGAVVPFIRDGLALQQPVMVAVAEPRLQALRDALDDDADRVVFADMAELGHNPAMIIPAWREFTQRTAGVPVRGVGEPIWAGRGPAEVAECQLHEALLTLAVDSATPLWLICPYDVEALDDAVVTESLRSHPTLTEAGSSQRSRFYGGARHAATMFARALPEPGSAIETITLDLSRQEAAADRILQFARTAGLPAGRSVKLAAAVDEVATVVAAGDAGLRIRLWQQDGAVVCEVGDAGEVDDPLIGRSTSFGPHSRERGIRLANHLCDLVQVRSNPSGTTVRMHSRL